MGNCCTGGWWPRVCRAILRVCSFHHSHSDGMRFLRGRVEVVDSLATTTTRMVISRHVQSGNFTPSLFNKCVVINSLAHVLPDNNGLSGLFRAHFHVAIRVVEEEEPQKTVSATLLWWWVNRFNVSVKLSLLTAGGLASSRRRRRIASNDLISIHTSKLTLVL